jgi:hypothetical protein
LPIEAVSEEVAMRTAIRSSILCHKPARSRSFHGLWWCLTPLGWLGGFVAGFILVAAGVQFGRAFSNISGPDSPAQMGRMPDTSYPCGVENPCFEKGRYQPIWL